MPSHSVKAGEADLLYGSGGMVIANEEIIIGDRGDYIWGYENETGGYVMQFPTGYEKWDELIACDVNGDGKAEIIQGDRSTDKVYYYDMYGNELFKWDFGFEEGDDLACIRLGFEGREPFYKILFADRNDFIYLGYGSSFSLHSESMGNLDFEYGDSIVAADIDDEATSQEFILADHDKNKMWIYDFPMPNSPPGLVGSLDLEDYFDLTPRDEVSAGDVNLDGREEIVIATQDNDNGGAKRGIHIFSIEYRNGMYSLNELSYFAIPFKKGGRMVVGDVNADGVDEIVWASQDGRVRVYNMAGDLLNGPNGLKTEFTYGAGLAVGDINGDSIAVGPPNRGTLHVVDTVLAVINAPPVDFDVINETGIFYSEFINKQTQTSIASVKATHDVKLTAELKYKEGIGRLVSTEFNIKTSLGYKLQKETGQSYETTITYRMLSDMADGALYVSTDYDVYEFPIISPPELAVINGKQQYILVTIPKGPPNVHFVNYDSNLHEIGDINTYPTRITELRNYDASNVLGVFTIEAGKVGSSYEQYMKQLNWKKNTNTFSLGISIGVKASLGSGVIAGFEGSFRGDYGYEKVSTHEVKFSDETSVLVAYDGRIEDSEKWYNVTGVIYTDSEDGHLVLDFYVPSKGSYYENRENSPIIIDLGLFKINYNAFKALNKPPECSIEVTPDSGKMPLKTDFLLHLTDPENGSLRWEMDFGDGFRSEGNATRITRVYPEEGTYQATLRVYDPWGANATCRVTINVQHNEKPMALFSYSPAELKVGEEVRFIDSSTDPDGEVAGWNWNFGDGSTSTERNPRHTYSQPGKYTVLLTVEDESGLKNAYSKEITVEPRNYLPTADFTFLPREPKAGEEVSFADKSHDRDGEVVSWSWDFGDGGTSSEAEPVHAFEKAGNYTVTLTVTDDAGGEDVKRLTIEVSTKPTSSPTETTSTEAPTTTQRQTPSETSETSESNSPSPTAQPTTTSASPEPSQTEAGGTCGPGLIAVLAILVALWRRR
ncbi:hypothetical protein A3L14_03210 [Thermococcus thioreducens]|uniref:PKD domain-containing protein n=1 Tax=Thermococcus thioreducens TaxID=277988 RepID=A0A2Z2MUH0_9EURY|nr:hypothetical protein A3L14_03210 [Thermococcus thioreducens]